MSGFLMISLPELKLIMKNTLIVCITRKSSTLMQRSSFVAPNRRLNHKLFEFAKYN